MIKNFLSDQFTTLSGVKEYIDYILKSEYIPAHIKGKPETALLVIQHGAEIGLSPSQALSQIFPRTDGTMTMRGDAAKALIYASGQCAFFKETEEGSIEEESYSIEVSSARMNKDQNTSAYSIQDAIRAGLWITDEDVKNDPTLRFNPWYAFPKRCIRYKAYGFLMRDLYPDVLKGIVISEEAQDYKQFKRKELNKPKKVDASIITSDARK